MMRKALKWILGFIIALAVIAGGSYLYLRYSPTTVASASALSQYTFTRLTNGNIDTTVSATGAVRTNQSGTVSWQASGIVGKVNVKVGDAVKANDIIASLDPAQLPNNIIQAQTSLATDQQALSNLQNNQSNLPTLQGAVITAQTALTTAQTNWDNLNSPRATSDQIAAAQAGVTLAQQKVNQAQSFYSATPGNPATDARKAAALATLDAARTAYDNAQSNLNYIDGHPSATDLANAQNALDLAKAQLADAQRALNDTTNGVDPNTLAADQAQVAADNSIIDQQNLRAPFSGTITNVSVLPGDIISQGKVAFQIDDESAYYIDLAVSEVDISKVQVGQTVDLSFDAIPNPTTPYTGTVTYVSQVGTTTSSVVNFTVTVKIDNPDAFIKPGITAAGNIVVNSVKNVLVVPSKAIKTVSGKKVVYVVTFTDANGQPVVQPTRATGQTGSGTQTGTGRQTRTPQPGQSNPPTIPTVQSAAGSTSGSSPNTSATPTITEQVSEVTITEGATNGTLTQISSPQLQAGALIVTNPPATGIPMTTSGSSGLGGLFGGLLGGRRGAGG